VYSILPLITYPLSEMVLPCVFHTWYICR